MEDRQLDTRAKVFLQLCILILLRNIIFGFDCTGC